MFLFPNQTAEIIALLYEATQGPPLPLDEPPALNPTGTSFLTKIHCLAHWLIGGVKGKQPPPLNGLQYKKDPSRPGSGVFIAHSTVAQKNYEDLLPGVLVPSSDSGSEGEESVVERSLPVVHYYTSATYSSNANRMFLSQQVARLIRSIHQRQVQCLPLPWLISRH